MSSVHAYIASGYINARSRDTEHRSAWVIRVSQWRLVYVKQIKMHIYAVYPFDVRDVLFPESVGFLINADSPLDRFRNIFVVSHIARYA